MAVPDSERLVRDYLVAAPAVSALVATRVSTELPPNPVWPLVTFTRIGGQAGLPSYLDGPIIEFSAWAATKSQAHQLARALYDAVFDIDGVHPLGFVTGVVEQGSGLMWNPDDTLDKPRYQFQAELWVTSL